MIVCLSPGGRTLTGGADAARRLHVATIGGVWTLERRTADAPWTVAARSLNEHHIGSLVHLPDAGLLLAGAHSGGLFVSRDDGGSWERSMSGIAPEHEHIFTLAAFERSGSTELWAGTQPAALYRSIDLGRTWTELPGVRAVPGTDAWNFPAPPFIAHVKHVAIHPREPATVYVCVEQGALLKSLDAGATWNEVTSYATPEDKWYHDAHRIVFTPSDPANMYLTSGEGLYHTTDAGRTWSHLTTRNDRVAYPDALFLDPGDERCITMAGSGRSPDAWTAGDATSAGAGILRSVDGGASWTELHDGLAQPIRGNFEAMSMYHHQAHLALFTGTAVGEVYERPDRDAPWKRIAADLPPVSKVGHYKRLLAAAVH
ncbi:MAG TPA: hypothetical protein VGP41_10355 [Candidatus Lustribacter sp.]|nr:hypothetical protein [Candidatus Lustribacter sp.]